MTSPELSDGYGLVRDVLVPVVGQQRATEIASQLHNQIDLLTIADHPTHVQHLGLEEEASAALHAAFALNTHLVETRFAAGLSLDNPESVATFVAQRFLLRDQERFGALFFDLKSQLIVAEEIFRGTSYACTVDTRLLMRRALLVAASSFILWHSHPSGNPTPSQHDIEFTRSVAKLGEQLKLRLLDHLIVTPDGRFRALRKERCW